MPRHRGTLPSPSDGASSTKHDPILYIPSVRIGIGRIDAQHPLRILEKRSQKVHAALVPGSASSGSHCHGSAAPGESGMVFYNVPDADNVLCPGAVSRREASPIVAMAKEHTRSKTRQRVAMIGFWRDVERAEHEKGNCVGWPSQYCRNVLLPTLDICGCVGH